MEGLLTPPLSSVSCEALLRFAGVTDIRFRVIMFSTEATSKKKKTDGLPENTTPLNPMGLLTLAFEGVP